MMSTPIKSFHSCRHFPFKECLQLADENLFERRLLVFILLVEDGKLGIRALHIALFLYGAREKVGANHHAFERRRSLERSILHISGLVAEYGARAVSPQEWDRFHL